MKGPVVVTGGAGFIGSHVVEALIHAGYRVTIIDNFSTGNPRNVHPDAHIYRCDIAHPDIQDILSQLRPEVVIHHAAQVSVSASVRDPISDAQVNISGSINLLEACRKTGVRKIVYASSAAVYGHPLRLPIEEDHPARPVTPYGVSKYAVEHYLRVYKELYGMEYTILRYANVYGPRQDINGEAGVLAIFLDKILNSQPCKIYGDGNQTRDFVYVKDVANATVLSVDHGDGGIFNISCQSETTINELVQILREELGTSADVIYSQQRAGDVRRSVLSNRRAKTGLGWIPQFDLRSGIKDMIRSLRTVHGHTCKAALGHGT